MPVKTINIDDIVVDQRTQYRPLSPENISKLEDLLSEGKDFYQPIDVFSDGDGVFLGHGHHRYHAFRNRGFTFIECQVYNGGLEDAIDYSCGPHNEGHGQPERREDRECRTTRMIERHPDWGDSKIAAHCGVADTTVKTYRSRFGNTEPEKRTGKDGKQYPTTRKQKLPDTPSQADIKTAIDGLVDTKAETVNKPGVDQAKQEEIRQTAAQIQVLSKEGCTAEQMAEKLDKSTVYLRRIASRFNIPLPEHAFSKRKKLDRNKIISETVNMLDGIASGLSMHENLTEGCDPDQLDGWIEILNSSMKQLNKFHQNLKGIRNGNEKTNQVCGEGQDGRETQAESETPVDQTREDENAGSGAEKTQ